MKFYSTIRMSVRAGDRIKDGNDIVGHQLKIKITKNKIAAPFREATVNLIYGEGVDRADELFQIALKAELIRQSGAWFSYSDDNGELRNFGGEDIKSQGREKMIEMIRRYPALFVELEEKIRGVKVEADEMSPEEIEAFKMAEKEVEAASEKAAEVAHEKNRIKLEKKLAAKALAEQIIGG